MTSRMKLVFALSALMFGSATTFIAVAAVPGASDGRSILGLPDTYPTWGPPYQGDLGPKDYPPGPQPGNPRDRQGRIGQPSIPIVPDAATPRSDYNPSDYPPGVLAIDSKNSCQLKPASDTVAARGECPMDKDCIVQERPSRTELPWKDSIGNPTPRQGGFEYRPFCR
jgi:hypothetical protein